MTALRQGMTLLEVILASTLLVVALGITFETMIASMDLSAHTETEVDLSRDGNEALRVIAADLTESGWAFPGLTDGATLPLSTSPWSDDRSARYYPFVIAQKLSGSYTRATQYEFALRDEARVRLQVVRGWPGDDAAKTLPALQELPMAPYAASGAAAAIYKTYRDSFYARSQELIFARQAVGTWSLQPKIRSVRMTMPDGDWGNPSADRNALGVLFPSGWKDDGSGGFVSRSGTDPYGVLMYGGRLDQASNAPAFESQWDTIVPPTYQDAVAPSLIPQDDLNIRDFTYAVVPSPVGDGTGRLVRAFRARLADEAGAHRLGVDPGDYISVFNNEGMKVDRVISDHVVRVMFDTFRTDPRLDVNQVRVVLYLVRPHLRKPNAFYTHRVDSVLAMRSRITLRTKDFETLGGDSGRVGLRD
jgi:type II secretory pathway component PulJ